MYQKGLSWVMVDWRSDIYEGEPIIPSPIENESCIKIFKADDGHPAFVRSFQMQRVFDKPDDLPV